MYDQTFAYGDLEWEDNTILKADGTVIEDSFSYAGWKTTSFIDIRGFKKISVVDSFAYSSTGWAGIVLYDSNGNVVKANGGTVTLTTDNAVKFKVCLNLENAGTFSLREFSSTTKIEEIDAAISVISNQAQAIQEETNQIIDNADIGSLKLPLDSTIAGIASISGSFTPFDY